MRLLTVVALLALVAGVAGCVPGSDGDPDDPSTPPTESTTGSGSQPTMEQTREQVRSTTQDVLELIVSDEGPLASAKPSLAGAYGNWRSCDDDLVTWSYDGDGRVDLGSGDSGLGFLREVRRAVEDQGWVYEPNPVSADPATSLTARKGPNLLRVQAYADQSFVLVSVLGPCIEPTTEQRADLETSRKSEPLELP